MTNIAALVNEYAALDAQIKELTDARSEIKKHLLKVAVYAPNEDNVLKAVIEGDFANIVFTQTFPNRFSQDLAETLLSPIDFKRCFAQAIKPTITPTVVIKSKALA